MISVRNVVNKMSLTNCTYSFSLTRSYWMTNHRSYSCHNESLTNFTYCIHLRVFKVTEVANIFTFYQEMNLRCSSEQSVTEAANTFNFLSAIRLLSLSLTISSTTHFICKLIKHLLYNTDDLGVLRIMIPDEVLFIRDWTIFTVLLCPWKETQPDVYSRIEA